MIPPTLPSTACPLSRRIHAADGCPAVACCARWSVPLNRIHSMRNSQLPAEIQRSRSDGAGNGSFGYKPGLPFHVYRARLQFAFGSSAAAVFIVAWLIGMLAGDGLALSIPAQCFVVGFCLPVCVYSTYLAWNRSPVISLYQDRLKLASGVFPWRQVVLTRRSILSVDFKGWRGDGPDMGPQYAHARLVQNVTSGCFATHYPNRIWCATSHRS